MGHGLSSVMSGIHQVLAQDYNAAFNIIRYLDGASEPIASPLVIPVRLENQARHWSSPTKKLPASVLNSFTGLLGQQCPPQAHTASPENSAWASSSYYCLAACFLPTLSFVAGEALVLSF